MTKSMLRIGAACPLDLKIGDVVPEHLLHAWGLPPTEDRDARPEKGVIPSEWFVVFGGLLHKAMDHLDRLGLHHFQPMYETEGKARHSRNYANPKTKGEIITRPLFPGYLFIEAGKGIDPKSIEGIMGILMTDETHYARVKHQTIVDLQKAIERRLFDDAAALRRVFSPGAMIAVRTERRDGSFHAFGSYRGKIEKVFKGKDTARILLDIFGRATPVDVDLIDLEAV